MAERTEEPAPAVTATDRSGVLSVSTLEGEKRNINVSEIAFIAHGSQKRAHEIGDLPQWFHGTTVGLENGELLDISNDPTGAIPEPLVAFYYGTSDFAFWSAAVFNEGAKEISVMARNSSITAVVPGRFKHGACQGFAVVAGHEFDYEGGLGSEGIDWVFAGREADRLMVDMRDGNTMRQAGFMHGHWDNEVLVNNGQVSVRVEGHWVPTMLDVTHHPSVDGAVKDAVTQSFGIQTKPTGVPTPAL